MEGYRGGVCTRSDLCMSKKFRGNEAVGGSRVQQDTGSLGPDTERKNERIFIQDGGKCCNIQDQAVHIMQRILLFAIKLTVST